MSVEKLSDSSRFYSERMPYAQVLNTISEYIKDNDAFRIYCYLLSKPRDWKVVKEWTAKHCNVGQRKSKQCWSYLERCGLIEYRTNRDEKGHYTMHHVHILNGSNFKPLEPFLREKEPENIPIISSGAENAPMDIHRCNYPPSGESTRVDFARQYNKEENTNKDVKTKKEKSFYEDQKKDNEKKHDFADSMNQMASEKKHIEDHEQIKRAPMPDNLRELCKKLKRG